MMQSINLPVDTKDAKKMVDFVSKLRTDTRTKLNKRGLDPWADSGYLFIDKLWRELRRISRTTPETAPSSELPPQPHPAVWALNRGSFYLGATSKRDQDGNVLFPLRIKTDIEAIQTREDWVAFLTEWRKRYAEITFQIQEARHAAKHSPVAQQPVHQALCAHLSKAANNLVGIRAFARDHYAKVRAARKTEAA